MQRENAKIEPGNLVTVLPGSYMTERTRTHEFPAKILLRDPTLGLVLENFPGKWKLVFLPGNTSSFIFATDSAMKKEGDTSND